MIKHTIDIIIHRHRVYKSFALLVVWVSTLLITACASATPQPTSTPSPTPSPVFTATPSSTSVPATAVPPSATPAPPTKQPTETPNPTLTAGLEGLWQGNNRSFYLFKSGGTWNWDQHLDRVKSSPENKGQWWLAGDVFNIRDQSGKGACPGSQIGTYEVKLDGDALTLTAIDDACRARLPQTQGKYERLP